MPFPLYFILLILLSACSIDWTAGKLTTSGFTGNTVTSSQVCQTLEDAIGTSEYCALASQYSSPTRFGNGSEGSPYVICSPYELNAIGTTASLIQKSFRLDANIDMSCITGNHVSIASGTTGYSGTFNGNGKEIRNWNHVDATSDYVGLFASVQGGMVKDLDMKNAMVTGKNNVGIIAGYGYASFFLRVKSSGSVSGNTAVGGIVGSEGFSISQSTSSASVSAASSAGGIVGSGGHVQIASSSFTGSVSVTGGTAGGIIGSTWGMVANCYSTGNISGGADKIGGLIGTSNYHIHNSYSTGAVSGTTAVGGLIGSLTATGSEILNSFSISQVTGNGGSNVNVGVLFGTNAGTVTNSFYYSSSSCDADSSTVGTQACGVTATGSYAALSDFYSSVNEPLLSWDFQSNSGDGNNDFWEERAGTFPVAWYDFPEAFSPAFAGSGTEASPYLISTEAEFNSIGMNPRLLEYHYKLTADLDFTGPGFTQLGSEEAPFLASFDGNGKSLSNIAVTKTTAFTGTFGLVGFKEIRNLTVTNINITGVTFTGGLIGYGLGNVTNCRTSGTVNGTYHVGGLVGLSVGDVDQSSSSVTVTGPGNAMGGLIGNNFGTISRSFATGNVTNAGTHIGGLVGSQSKGSIESSYATGNVSTGSLWISNYGGLVGYLINGIVMNSYATGNVTAANNSYTGGLIGNNSAGTEIRNCFSTGDVTSNGGVTRTGPLVGNSLLTITNSFSLATSSCDSGSAVGVQACNVLGTGTVAQLSDLYDPLNDPLDQWDFVSVWESDGTSLPVLR